MKWSTEVSEVAQAPRHAVWALWSDVSTWPSWDAGVEHVSIDGPFAAGSSGTLKPTGARAVPFALIETVVDSGFVDETKLPLARMRFEHSLEDAPDGNGTLVTHRCTIEGPLTPLWSRVIGRGIERDMPETVRTLAAHAA